MNKYWFYKVGLVVVFLCFALLGGAKVKLPTLVSDGMVLQRGEPVNIWGTADPDETVDITFLKKKYKTVADVQGNWKVTLPILKAGGPYTMAINDIELKDILIGDVWVCSGQSNMELPVSRVTDRFRDEISTDSNYPMVRYIKTPLLYNFHAPQADIPGISWQAMTPENVMPFSALAYFFAKDVYQKTKVPVGIINSSVGGSPVEAWISEGGLKPFPFYLNEKRIYESDDLMESMKKEERKKSHAWNVALFQGDNWQARETLCQALAYSVQSGDWYSLLAALNHEQAPARLHWLATLLMDALKRHHGAAQVTNVDVPGLVVELANHLSPSRLQAILGDVCHIREQLMSVTGINRELLITDLLLRIEHYLQPGVVLPVPHL